MKTFFCIDRSINNSVEPCSELDSVFWVTLEDPGGHPN